MYIYFQDSTTSSVLEVEQSVLYASLLESSLLEGTVFLRKNIKQSISPLFLILNSFRSFSPKRLFLTSSSPRLAALLQHCGSSFCSSGTFGPSCQLTAAKCRRRRRHSGGCGGNSFQVQEKCVFSPKNELIQYFFPISSKKCRYQVAASASAGVSRPPPPSYEDCVKQKEEEEGNAERRNNARTAYDSAAAAAANDENTGIQQRLQQQQEEEDEILDDDFDLPEICEVTAKDEDC